MQTAKVKTLRLSTKKWMFNAQNPKEKIRGRVLVDKSVNKMLI